MRHGKKINHLGRTASHRSAMLSNMASSLIKHKRIITTVAKAKSLRVFVEPIITRSKVSSTHNYRTAFSYLKDKEAVKELFTVVGEKVANRPGGYTRILKTGNRAGDNAEMAMIELVDFNEFFEGFGQDKKKATTRRSRRGGSTTAKSETPAAKVSAPVIEDAVVEEVVAVEEVPAVEEVVAVEEAPAVTESTEVTEGNDDAADSTDSADGEEKAEDNA
jgi:large subunit ribosomal protein L17